MIDEILRAIPIYFSCMFKFILGPVGGYAIKLNILTTIITTVAGMMTVVLAFAFFGDWLRMRFLNRIFRKRKKFSERNRRFVLFWRKYGLAGVAALTPIVFTPIVGALLAVSFGSPRDKLIIYMFISASFWSVALTLVIYLFGNSVLPEFLRP